VAETPRRRLFAARAVLLLLSGVIITFTAALHDTVVSQWLFLGSVVLVALGDVLLRLRSDRARPALMHAVLQSVLAAASALATLTLLGNTVAFGLTVTVWAALTAMLDVWTGWSLKGRDDAREFSVVGVLAGVLAVLLVLLPGSPVSIIGLFGGYAVIVGVYLAIAAADRVPQSPEKASA